MRTVRRRGDAYIILLPEELAIVGRAEPLLVLQVIHWDGEVGLGGQRSSGQKDHRLLLCGENSRWFYYPHWTWGELYGVFEKTRTSFNYLINDRLREIISKTGLGFKRPGGSQPDDTPI